jgi:hypothetical protein
MRHTGVILLAAALISVPAWSQTTTGRLIGTTADESGAVLPGVSVTISSPVLIGGAQAKITDEWGEFVFLSLAPGDYTANAALHGFVTQERGPIKVPLGGAAVVNIAMPAGTFSGEIEVVDTVPVIDTTQVNTGQVFQQDYMQGSAIGSDNRSYTMVVNQTAGVVGGERWSGVPQPRVFGSTLGENAYFIDGMDTTNPLTGTANATVNFDAISEIQLQTGGFEAEYGRATGGIINLVSKVGGNRFSGTFDARYRDDSFQEGGEYFDASELSTKHQIFGATLGGPILYDRLWFFASYEQINDLFTPVASPVTRDQTGQNFLGKITWQIAPAWRLSGKYTTDPTTWENGNASRWMTPEAASFKKGTTKVASTELTAVLSDALLWNTSLGTYSYESNIYPLSGDLTTINHYNFTTDFDSENFFHQQYWETSRQSIVSDLTWFVDDLAGSHEFKGGVEYSHLNTTASWCLTGSPTGDRCVDGGVGFNFMDIEVEGMALPYLMWELQSDDPEELLGTVESAFAQDSWRPARNLTLKIGLRYDAVDYEQAARMDLLQPRLGIAWDIGGDAKNILRVNVGRFMHASTMSLPGTNPEPAYGPGSFDWLSCSTIVGAASAEECAEFADAMSWDYRMDNAGWDPHGWVLPPEDVSGGEPDRSDPNLGPAYADQLILAFEREVGSRSAIELTFVDKRTRDIIDSTCNGNWPTPSPDAECAYYFTANFSELRRDFKGFMVTFETRKLSWLTLLASYTLSSSKGSVDYTQNSSNILDFYPWHWDNIYGYLWDHRRHTLKLNGFFNLRGDWTFAFDARWASPFTWTPFENRGDNLEIPYGRHLLEPLGNREANSNHQLDLQLSKGFRAGPIRIVLIGSVLNVLSSEQPTDVCEHISGCGFDEDGNPFNMGDPTGWQTPRLFEVGFRIEF